MISFNVFLRRKKVLNEIYTTFPVLLASFPPQGKWGTRGFLSLFLPHSTFLGTKITLKFIPVIETTFVYLHPFVTHFFSLNGLHGLWCMRAVFEKEGMCWPTVPCIKSRKTEEMIPPRKDGVLLKGEVIRWG